METAVVSIPGKSKMTSKNDGEVTPHISSKKTDDNDSVKNKQQDFSGRTSLSLPKAVFIGKTPSVLFDFEPSLYRGDSRGFNVMFNEGFIAKGRNIDLMSHVFSSSESAYISTSTSKELAAKFPLYYEGVTYLYELKTAKQSLDVKYLLTSSMMGCQLKKNQLATLDIEKEKAFLYKIKPNEIKGGWEVKASIDPYTFEYPRVVSEQFVPNPNYNPSIHPAWLGVKATGHIFTGVGLFSDASRLYSEYQYSKSIYDYDNTYQTGVGIAGGWAGAWAMGTTYAQIGAKLCGRTAITAIACSIAGGIYGSIEGYQSGEDVARKLYEVNKNSSLSSDTLFDLSFPLFSFSSAAYASSIITDEPFENPIVTGNTPLVSEPRCKSQSLESSELTIIKEVPLMNTEKQLINQSFSLTELAKAQENAEKTFKTLDTNLQELIRTWCEEATNIQGFEGCKEVMELSNRLTQLQTMRAPVYKILEATSELKNAKTREHAKRLAFDNSLQTVEGLVNLGAAASFFSGNSRLAQKIITGGAALVSIGKQFGALAGFGTLATHVNPVMAAGTIALGFMNLASIFGDDDNDEAMQALFELIQQFRKEMHERFDIIEEKLEKIYADLSLKIEQIDFKTEQIKLQNEETHFLIKQETSNNKQAHIFTHQHLENIQQKINGLYSVICNQQINQALHAITDPIRCCLNSINSIPSAEQYSAWLAQFKMHLEQSAYSAILTGNQSQSADGFASTWNLENKASSEGFFYVNSLLGYLREHLPKYANFPNQPNMLLWAYPSLAILRLVYLTNHSEMTSIRRNEFNILDLIAKKAREIQSFYLDIKSPAIVTKLVDDYRNELLRVAKEMKAVLSTLNKEKNKVLNEEFHLQRNKEWLEHSHALANQDITIRTDYSNWFKGWANTHYGGQEHCARLVSQPKKNYIQARTNFLTLVKTKRSQPKFVPQQGLQISLQGTQITTKVHMSPSQHLRHALLPSVKSDPILNLFTDNVYIDIAARLNVPPICFEAEYLGVGHLRYIYNVDHTKLGIVAYFHIRQSSYPIGRVDCDFHWRSYERKEGILWGWKGDSQVTLKQEGPYRWYGSTGEARHWFDSFGYVPVVSCPDAGPFMSLANPNAKNARSFTYTSYSENEIKISHEMTTKLKAILTQYETDLKKEALVQNSPLGLALTSLEAAYQRLHAYVMLALPDTYTNKGGNLSIFFKNTSGGLPVFPSKSSLLKTLAPQDALTNSSFLTIKHLDDLAGRIDVSLAKPLQQAISENKNKTDDHLFDAIFTQVINAYDFYQNRIDDSDTYENIFAENKKTLHNFEQVTTLLDIIVNSVDSEVTDLDIKKRILAKVQEQISQQQIAIGTVSPQNKSSRGKVIQALPPSTVKSELNRFGMFATTTTSMEKDKGNGFSCISRPDWQ